MTKYNENEKVTGFGDFIRGCYFIIEFCNINHFKYNFIINHPISEFLYNFKKKSILTQYFNKEIFSNINIFTENNWVETELDACDYIINFKKDIKMNDIFIKYLCRQTIVGNHLFIYNIMFPYEEDINIDSKKYIQNLLKPSEEMELYINNVLDSIGLTKNCYSIIHIRSGDSYLNSGNKIFQEKYLNIIFNDLFNLIYSNTDINYLLISDNNEIKILLKNKFPNLNVLFINITHLGEGNVLDKNKIKDTLLDFYLMSHSNSIDSFTSYIHGSGFSYWCAKTYDIPYNCKVIKM